MLLGLADVAEKDAALDLELDTTTWRKTDGCRDRLIRLNAVQVVVYLENKICDRFTRVIRELQHESVVGWRKLAECTFNLETRNLELSAQGRWFKQRLKGHWQVVVLLTRIFLRQ